MEKMSFSTRNHPELGYDKIKEQWYIFGGTYAVKKFLKEAGGLYEKETSRWYYDSLRGELVWDICERANALIKKQRSEKGKAVYADAAKEWNKASKKRKREVDKDPFGQGALA